MKKIISCLLMIVLLTAAIKLSAQNMNKMQEAWRSYLKDSMQLSEALTDSVMAVRMQYQPQMHEIFMDQSSSPEDKQAKIKDMRMAMDTRYKSAGLTDDQIKKIHEREERLRAAMMNKTNTGGQ